MMGGGGGKHAEKLENLAKMAPWKPILGTLGKLSLGGYLRAILGISLPPSLLCSLVLQYVHAGQAS